MAESGFFLALIMAMLTVPVGTAVVAAQVAEGGQSTAVSSDLLNGRGSELQLQDPNQSSFSVKIPSISRSRRMGRAFPEENGDGVSVDTGETKAMPSEEDEGLYFVLLLVVVLLFLISCQRPYIRRLAFLY